MTSLDAGGIATSGARFLGQRRFYWRLLIRGAALLMVTLGIYRFWLVTDVRRFLWSNTEIAGEALEYTGTALELLLGFLVAIALLIPIYAGFFLAALDMGLFGKLSGIIAFAALGTAGAVGLVGAGNLSGLTGATADGGTWAVRDGQLIMPRRGRPGRACAAGLT